MRGLGTIMNTLAVVLGGLAGMRFRAGIPEKIQNTLMQACGISTIFIGGAGAIAGMLTATGAGFSTQGTMLLVLSLVLGGALGEWVDLEDRMERLGEKLKLAVKAQGDSGFVEGFVNVSLIICVGAMAIVGSIQDGIRGDYSMLAAKAVLDMIIVMIFASSYGVGAVFSALAIFVYQGAITLAAVAFGAFASERIIGDLSFVGSVLIFCVGVNIAFGKRFRVGNLLPSMAVTVALDLLFTALGIGMI